MWQIFGLVSIFVRARGYKVDVVAPLPGSARRVHVMTHKVETNMQTWCRRSRHSHDDVDSLALPVGGDAKCYCCKSRMGYLVKAVVAVVVAHDGDVAFLLFMVSMMIADDSRNVVGDGDGDTEAGGDGCC